MTKTDEITCHIQSLRRLRDMALAARKTGPAITAEVAIGRALLGLRAEVEQGPKTLYEMSDQELLEIARGGRRE